MPQQHLRQKVYLFTPDAYLAQLRQQLSSLHPSPNQSKVQNHGILHAS